MDIDRQGVRRISLRVRVPPNENNVVMICHRTTRGSNLIQRAIISRDEPDEQDRDIFLGYTQGRVIQGVFEVGRDGLKWTVGIKVDLTAELNAYSVGIIFAEGIPARWGNLIPNSNTFNGLEEEHWIETTSAGVTVRATLIADNILTRNWALSIRLSFMQ